MSTRIGNEAILAGPTLDEEEVKEVAEVKPKRKVAARKTTTKRTKKGEEPQTTVLQPVPDGKPATREEVNSQAFQTDLQILSSHEYHSLSNVLLVNGNASTATLAIVDVRPLTYNCWRNVEPFSRHALLTYLRVVHFMFRSRSHSTTQLWKRR
jgi:hypothetical protein